jgi:hypothetical protein
MILLLEKVSYSLEKVSYSYGHTIFDLAKSLESAGPGLNKSKINN